MICTKCDKNIADCQCPGKDEQLKSIAMNPAGLIAFKWCRACDKHHARCWCRIPDWCVLHGGKVLELKKESRHA